MKRIKNKNNAYMAIKADGVTLVVNIDPKKIKLISNEGEPFIFKYKIAK